MKCAWKQFLDLLPPTMRPKVDRLGRENLQELRLRIGCQPLLVCANENRWLTETVNRETLSYVVNMACRYSPWTAESASMGYVTAPGGHRIGLCGQMAEKDGQSGSFTSLRSLNIRVARDFPGIASALAPLSGNVLLLGPPGSGKTTLLRDLIRQRAKMECVGVADERGELLPEGLEPSIGADVLTGCRKPEAIAMLLRTMGPDVIAVDEITQQQDCTALIQASWCGVRVLATAHAHDAQDLQARQVYKPIVTSGVFDWLVVLKRDKTYRVERMVRSLCGS